MDRDPRHLYKVIGSSAFSSNVVVLGDACHAMSPFKGQGANQALLDGPLLSSWLQQANRTASIHGFWREMVERTSAKIQSSAQAAQWLHTPSVLNEPAHFAGVRPECIDHLLAVLRNRGIDSSKAERLDYEIRNVVDEFQAAVTLVDDIIDDKKSSLEQDALFASIKGDTHTLRIISLRYAPAVRRAMDSEQRSCLYLASREGHLHVCRWLLTEVFITHDDPVDESVIYHIVEALSVSKEKEHGDIANLLSFALTLSKGRP